MKVISFLTITITALSLVSCSSVSREDCKRDMKSFGLNQGKKGLSSLSDDIRKTCISSDKTVDLEAYEKGFNMGWSEYCTPFNGFQNGKKGDIYKSYCPADKEDLYREKFLIGKKVYEKNDQVHDLEDKMKDLTPEADRGDLGSREELTKIRNYVLEINRDIQVLEQKGRSPVHTDY